MDTLPADTPSFRLISVEDYAPLIGDAAVERLQAKAARHRDLHLVNVNSTYYGGGVAVKDPDFRRRLARQTVEHARGESR